MRKTRYSQRVKAERLAVSRHPTMKGLVNHGKGPGFYPEGNGNVLKGLKQESDIIRLAP